jgi:hypothetical protein
MTKTMLAAVIAALGLVAAGSAVNAQQVIESRVSLDQWVAMPDNSPTIIAHIDLPAGRWLVSGLINFFEIAEHGTVFVGASIGLDSATITEDGTTLFTSLQLDSRRGQNVVLGAALPPRLVYVGVDPRVNLVGWSHMPGQPPPDCHAWGFICAQRLGN